MDFHERFHQAHSVAVAVTKTKPSFAIYCPCAYTSAQLPLKSVVQTASKDSCVLRKRPEMGISILTLPPASASPPSQLSSHPPSDSAPRPLALAGIRYSSIPVESEDDSTTRQLKFHPTFTAWEDLARCNGGWTWHVSPMPLTVSRCLDTLFWCSLTCASVNLILVFASSSPSAPFSGDTSFHAGAVL